MEFKDIKGVFFDCWDTLIRFHLKDEDWNTHSLKKHAIGFSNYDWNEIDLFAEQFFSDYYAAHLEYEISISQIINLFVRYFSIQVDCSIDQIAHEILDSLDPTPVDGVREILDFLNDKDIYHAVISNTVYREDDSMAILDRLLPNHGLSFFYGSSEAVFKKPNPNLFLCALKPTGLNIKDCMYIGDAFYQDVMGSARAGFGKSVWLNYKKKKKDDFLSKDWFEGLDYLEVDGYDTLLKEMKKEIL